MPVTTTHVEPVVLHLTPSLQHLTGEEFLGFCRRNFTYRIECNADGDLEIMPPVGATASHRSSRFGGQLTEWAIADGTGLAFASSTGFQFPNGATRTPEGSWALRNRYERLTPAERQRFPPFAPDFVAEIRMDTESLGHLHSKLQEFIDNGVRLGWLIDPESRSVWVYQPGSPPRQLEHPETVAGDPVLPGFVLNLDAIWGSEA